jgi:DNA adenine methylase
MLRATTKTQVKPPSPPDPRGTPRPFLKWVGGKGQLLSQLWPHLPERFERYHEPFLGGGALFFALRPQRAFLSDVNRELIDCYTAVRDRIDDVIEALREHRYEQEHYYEVRAQNPFSLSPGERAARTIFLNRTGFNGLYRVNRSGQFNVPFGRYTNPLICDEFNLRACSRVLQGAELQVRDFTLAADQMLPGDLAYFDPPYVPVSSTANFTGYSADGFNSNDQARLARLFGRLIERGVHGLLSNADMPALRQLYSPFPAATLQATRAVNCDISKRGKVSEVLVLGRPIAPAAVIRRVRIAAQ